MKNIFYTSNADKDLFIDDTRSDFNSYIDINDLDYIDDGDVEVGIKSIAFDNTQSIYIQPNVKQPHFIIVQEAPKKDFHPTLTYHHLPKIVSLKCEELIQELINVEELEYSNTLFLSPHVAHIRCFQKYDGSNKEY